MLPKVAFKIYRQPYPLQFLLLSLLPFWLCNHFCFSSLILLVLLLQVVGIHLSHVCWEHHQDDPFSRCPSTVSRTVWKRKRVNFQRIFLVSPTEKERKHAFVRVQIEYGFGCFQVRFGLVVSTVWIGSEYGFVTLVDESASESHTQNSTRTARKPGSILSDALTYWWGATLCPPELNDVSLAESVVITMRYAAIKQMYLNTEVQKPSLEDILEFKGDRMACTVEATPHPNARAYLSAYEGGGVMQEFEVENADEIKDQKQQGMEIRSEGAYSCPVNPWPRDLDAEAREMAHLMQKRKPTYKRQGQGNRWDHYGESSSAISSEAHVMSEKANAKSNLQPMVVAWVRQ